MPEAPKYRKEILIGRIAAFLYRLYSATFRYRMHGEDPEELEKALRGPGVHQHDGVARHQRRRCESDDLPEREVPRHDPQDHTQRLVMNEGGAVLRLNLSVGQHPFCTVRVVPAHPCTLGDLGSSFAKWLAHFQGRKSREFLRVLDKEFGETVNGSGPFGERTATPHCEAITSTPDDVAHLTWLVLVVSSDDEARERVDRFHDSIVGCSQLWRQGTRSHGEMLPVFRTFCPARTNVPDTSWCCRYFSAP